MWPNGTGLMKSVSMYQGPWTSLLLLEFWLYSRVPCLSWKSHLHNNTIIVRNSCTLYNEGLCSLCSGAFFPLYKSHLNCIALHQTLVMGQQTSIPSTAILE